MKKLLLVLLLILIPVEASAGIPTYTGNLVVPTGGTFSITGGGTGCALGTVGQIAIGACPSGTAVFTGSAPIVITGSNPYTITCPTCVSSSSPNTFTAAQTFSSTATFNGQVTMGGTLTGASLNIGTTNTNTPTAIYIGSPATGAGHLTQIGTGSTVGPVQGVTGTIFGIADLNAAWEIAIDTSGNLGVRNNITAATMFSTSLRSHKQDIHPLHIDALSVLRDTDWSSFRYLPQWGDPSQTHIGFIADDTPSILSGPKHDHFDAQALSTVDAQAILQLETKVNNLGALLFTAVVVMLLLLLALFGVVFCGKKS